MSVQTEKAKANPNPNMWYYINSVVCVVLMVGFRFLPTFGQVTPYGMEVLGIFFGPFTVGVRLALSGLHF